MVYLNYEAMLYHCLMFRKVKTERKNPTFLKRKNERMILLSDCAVCNSKK